MAADVELHVVAQVVEAEFVVGAVGDVAVVGDLPLLIVEIVLDDADRQAEEAVDAAHPFRVAAGQVVVHGDDVNAFAVERVEIGGQRGDERLAFAGLHFGDLAVVQDHAADHLHVVVAHAAATRRPASRTTANASGRRSSSVSPLARRVLNSAVLPRSCSSLSALIAGSNALMSATRGRNRFSSRSFCVPTILVRSWPTLEEDASHGLTISSLYRLACVPDV